MKYNFTPQTCWYKDVCGDSGTDECSIYCIRFGQMKHMIETSNLPKTLCYPIKLEPTQSDLSAFIQLDIIRKNIVEFVQSGRNLYIFSNVTGNGKTSWSAKLMLKYFDQVWENNCYKERGLFVSVTDLLIHTRMFGFNDDKTKQLLNKIKSMDLVIWDDIATGRLTPADFDLLYSLINYRVVNGLSNIYTGNLGAEQLNEMVGNKLFSRIWDDSTVIEFTGRSKRGQK